MTSEDIMHYLIDPQKKIEVFLVKSNRRDVQTIVNSVLESREKNIAKRKLAMNLILVVADNLNIRIKMDSLMITPLRKFSEVIAWRYKSILSDFRVRNLHELSPMDLLLPVNLKTIIFYKKIKSLLTRKTIDLMELMLREARSFLQVVISLLTAIYYDYLSRKQREIIEKYFLLSKNFPKTLFLAALFYLLLEESAKIIIITKKTYFKERYLAGYTTKELPIGTKLVVIEKASSYYRARELGSRLGRTYILHTDEVEIIGKAGNENREVLLRAKKIIEQLTDQQID